MISCAVNPVNHPGSLLFFVKCAIILAPRDNHVLRCWSNKNAEESQSWIVVAPQSCYEQRLRDMWATLQGCSRTKWWRTCSTWTLRYFSESGRIVHQTRRASKSSSRTMDRRFGRLLPIDQSIHTEVSPFVITCLYTSTVLSCSPEGSMFI